jgi:hypothetical protein
LPEIDTEIDGLASSVVHELSGQVLATRIVHIRKFSRRQKSELTNWRFDWSAEVGCHDREVLALYVKGSTTVQGLMSLQDAEKFVFVTLLESAPHNVGYNKLFRGVPGNLFAYARSRSFAREFDGFVGFEAKTQLIEHYKASLGAERIGSSNRMLLPTASALNLVKRYFKETDRWPL